MNSDVPSKKVQIQVLDLLGMGQVPRYEVLTQVPPKRRVQEGGALESSQATGKCHLHLHPPLPPTFRTCGFKVSAIWAGTKDHMCS